MRIRCIILFISFFLLFSCSKDGGAPADNLINIRYEIKSNTELPFTDAVFSQSDNRGNIKDVREFGMKGDGTFFKEVQLPEGGDAKVVVRHRDSDDWYAQILSANGEILIKGKPEFSDGIYYVSLTVRVKR
ncbi:hypothetical protein [Chitinophaga tropicalis]|uniref:PLAT domain-containing protein n=1 Tax=Chitinophaga tropicalis TaxID=2683588 RepID=A0A7K1UAE5_9BACT|nr:hypothetical protein [Chitinophaga tropicalis]MVT11337.1 hypothetical protein [Chitinophaga tropicalis]